ncbi:MAG: ComEC family competence protein [Bacteroidales bacterium]|jgi:competence protein ComEC|nr:ComEC family competence protein [Bacteroidales bacterium]
MNPWRPFPLLRLVFPFLAGIGFAITYGFNHKPQPLLPGIFLIILFFTILVPRTFRLYRYRWISGLLINGFIFVIAFQLVALHQPTTDKVYFGDTPEGTFLTVVTEPPSIKLSYTKAILEIRQRRNAGKWQMASGKTLAYLKPDRNAHPVQFGDILLIHTRFQGISDNANPHSFRYAGFLIMKGITHQSYISTGFWKKFSAPSPLFFRRFAYRLRDRMLDILRHNGVKGKEFAVASALLLGYVEELDDELRRDYSATGAMHILSVSGMHVGIIYVFLEFLLLFLSRNKTGRILKTIILLVFIWFYAFLTGLSPCVLRAAAMLSLPILGKSLDRPSGMPNILSASLILILILDPFLVLDIGFQLSYLAVIGIVLFYKPVYDRFTFTSWFPDKIWSILAVSIAAQLSTLPITLYTFHQFPNYFMLTNIFVVPLSSLIIYNGILVLVVGSVPFFSLLAARVLSFLIWSLNSIIHFIEQLPYSTLRGFHPGLMEMMMMYVAILAGFLMLTTRKPTWVFVFLLTIIMLSISSFTFRLKRLSSCRFVVYNSRGNSLLQFSFQNRAVLFYDFTTYPGEDYFQRVRQIVQGDLDAHGICFRRFYWNRRKVSGSVVPKNLTCLNKSGRFFQFCGKRIGILSTKIPKGFYMKMDLDYLVLSGNPPVDLSEAMNVFHPGEIVIDGSNSGFRIKQWLEDSRKLKVPCYTVSQDGAFERDF